MSREPFYKPEVRAQMKTFEDGLKQTLFNEINKRNMEETKAEEENQSNLDQGGIRDVEEVSQSESGGDSGSVPGGGEGGETERSVS